MKLFDLRLVFGINASLIVAFENFERISLHDDTQTRRSVDMRIVILEPEGRPLGIRRSRTGVRAFVIQPEELWLLSSRLDEGRIRVGLTIAEL